MMISLREILCGKRTCFKRNSSKYENHLMVMSHSSSNLDVAESSLLLNPLQFHQQGAQVPDIQASLMQCRSQGEAIHRDRRVVQKVLQLPPGQTHGLHQDRALFNPALIQKDSHHRWNLMRQQKSCRVPQQQLLSGNLSNTFRGEPNTCSINKLNENFHRASWGKGIQKMKSTIKVWLLPAEQTSGLKRMSKQDSLTDPRALQASRITLLLWNPAKV